ncbi:hypothetical protein ACQP1S_10930 [Micromonospora matsumotoense]|uniref:hypothetical protein n=1 Tax=Micromonospora matsumotoense TaxID=121616 RepID=UPI003D8F2FF8
MHLSSDALHAGRPIPCLDDDVPTPVHPYGAAKAAAETAVRVVDPGAALELAGSAVAGPLNVAGPEPVSRAGLGLLVARRYGIDPAGMTTTTTTAAGPRRPTDVRLDSSRATALLRTRLRGVTELLAG